MAAWSIYTTMLSSIFFYFWQMTTVKVCVKVLCQVGGCGCDLCVLSIYGVVPVFHCKVTLPNKPHRLIHTCSHTAFISHWCTHWKYIKDSLAAQHLVHINIQSEGAGLQNIYPLIRWHQLQIICYLLCGRRYDDSSKYIVLKIIAARMEEPPSQPPVWQRWMTLLGWNSERPDGW